MMLFRPGRMGVVPAADGAAAAGGETGSYNAMPLGKQRFLAKKGINTPEDLDNRLQTSYPRVNFRNKKY